MGDGRITQFLDTVYGAKDPEHWLAIWTLADLRTAWLQDLAEAEEYISQRAGQDIFACVGLYPNKSTDYKRGGESQIIATAAFVCEVDYGKDPAAHKGKSNRPATKMEALALIEEMPIQPSLIVHSGHGYHAWWAFDEPWEIESDEERARVKWHSQNWGQVLKKHAALHGWAVDSIFDLARLVRIPGTLNCKGGPDHKVPCEIVAESSTRIGDLAEFERYFLSPTPLEDYKAQPTLDEFEGLTCDPDAIVDEIKLRNFLDADPRIKAAFEYKGKYKDDSGSSQDMALANFAARAGWSEQEIINLMIQARRIALGDIKRSNSGKVRIDYYVRTMRRARKEAIVERAQEDVLIAEADDETVMDQLGITLGLKLDRIVRYATAGGGLYYLVSDSQWIKIGPAGNILDQRKLRTILFDAGAELMRTVKQAAWDYTARLIRKRAEEASLGEYGSERGIILAYLEQWLDATPPRPNNDKARALSVGTAFEQAGDLWFRPEALCRWVRNVHGIPMTPTQVITALKQGGATPKSINYQPRRGKEDAKRSTRSCWPIPEGVGELYVPYLIQETEESQAAGT